MKKLKALIGIVGLFVMVTSCSSDSGSSQNTMKIVATATYSNSAKTNTSGVVMNSGVVLNSFKINIKQIEFKLADAAGTGGEDSGMDHHGNGDNNHDGMYNGDDETALNGPWELDLLNQSAPVTTVTIANGTYEEVEFKLNKSLVTTSPMYNKTVQVTGTINGTPFVFWHNFEQHFSIDYHNPTQNLVVSNSSFDLVLNIDLNQVMSQVDLTSAVDGNGNGTIEIGPDDTDGNNALATALNDHIGHACEMHDEHHH